MPTRRNILRGGLGLSLAPLFAGRAAAKNAPQLTVQDIWVDTDLEAARAFATRAETLGANLIEATQTAARDLMPQLDLDWRTTPVPLAGVTTHGPMFTLEMLGRRHGMRLAYAANMIRWEDGSVGIDVTGTAALAGATPTPGKSDAAWAIEMADFTLASTLEDLTTGPQTTQQIGERFAGSYDDPLFVWVIAPTKNATRYIAPALTS